MSQMNPSEEKLERAAAQIRDAQPDPRVVEGAAHRVWDRIAASAAAEATAQAAEVEEIRGCDDYQALIPAYLAGDLPQARRLLLEDHCRECVPCRRALKIAREGRTAVPAGRSRATRRSSAPWGRWATAAAAVLAVAAAAFLAWEMLPVGSGPAAVVASSQGDLFKVGSSAHTPLAERAEIMEGEVFRTGRDNGAVVRLRDGSLVELRERTELSIRENRRGTTLDLERGSVIVEAAEQRKRKLYVATEDCLVSVTGTIFSVNHGTKGSRVSVIEGEVRVDHEGRESVLNPGEQLATHASLIQTPIADEIAWSKDLDRYLGVLTELSDLRRDLRQTLSAPDLRFSSRLLDLMPEGTVLYGAVPNLSQTLGDAQRMIQERINSSDLLREWWQEEGPGADFQGHIDEVLSTLERFGEQLGGEIAVGLRGVGDDEPEVVALAETLNSEAFRDLLLESAANWGHDGLRLIFVEDPMSTPGGSGDALYIWLSSNAVAASPSLPILRQVAAHAAGADNPFRDGDFYQQILSLYGQGAEILVAADLENLVGEHLRQEGSTEQTANLERLGVTDIRHLMLEQKSASELTHHRAVLTFAQPRRGITSWLAEPAPMGSLDFVSPDAQVFAAFVFKDPEAMLQDLEELMPEVGLAQMLGRVKEEHSIDLQQDFAAALGGEVAFAIDGPLLPTPSWKLILEAYDPARLQWVFEQAVAQANVHLSQQGLEPVEILTSNSGGRTIYTLPTQVMDVHYTFVEGYLVMAQSRALLDRAMRFRQSGFSITTSSRFAALLPADRQQNFSALMYQDLAALLGPVAERLASGGQLSDEQKAVLEELRQENGPTLAYVYGEPERILLAAAGEHDLLSSGLLAAIGMRNPLGMGALFQALGSS